MGTKKPTGASYFKSGGQAALAALAESSIVQDILGYHVRRAYEDGLRAGSESPESVIRAAQRLIDIYQSKRDMVKVDPHAVEMAIVDLKLAMVDATVLREQLHPIDDPEVPGTKES